MFVNDKKERDGKLRESLEVSELEKALQINKLRLKPRRQCLAFALHVPHLSQGIPARDQTHRVL